MLSGVIVFWVISIFISDVVGFVAQPPPVAGVTPLPALKSEGRRGSRGSGPHQGAFRSPHPLQNVAVLLKEVHQGVTSVFSCAVTNHFNADQTLLLLS